MIEKVRTALLAAFSEQFGCGSDRCSCWGAEEILACKMGTTIDTLACAAIETMREPTEAMRQAAARGVSDSFHEEGFQEGDDPALWDEFVKAGERAWNDAINAALKEDE